VPDGMLGWRRSDSLIVASRRGRDARGSNVPDVRKGTSSARSAAWEIGSVAR
jgi:hypothetical protein